MKLPKESQSGTKISWDEFSTRTDIVGKWHKYTTLNTIIDDLEVFVFRPDEMTMTLSEALDFLYRNKDSFRNIDSEDIEGLCDLFSDSEFIEGLLSGEYGHNEFGGR